MAKPVYDESIVALGSAEEAIQLQWLANNISKLEDLTDRQQQVLVKRFGLGSGQMLSVAEIATQLGVSKQWIYVTIRNAFKRMARIDPPQKPERMPSQDPMVDELDISPRTTRRLLSAGILTIHDLCNCTTNQLLEIKGLGRGSLEEIEHMLAYYGRRLRTK
ncbi:MAG TPA: DNA-directed RNA polymerase subunit alpha C-terminal domain-containing protein [Candidatus Dormibacteraeota bacterium]|nr:DNA-directed RNA polymerase subunit alpha C-terminal domain-containing protein [Candidatus Dormibacteraeota bacterium]